jgi:hypothetical protein
MSQCRESAIYLKERTIMMGYAGVEYMHSDIIHLLEEVIFQLQHLSR